MSVTDQLNAAQLNVAQREAIGYRDGPCLVIAGAGSGKTRVITQKIARMIEAGYSPAAIAAITFTNKAAAEMAARLALLIKVSSGPKPTVCTFHSLGVQILRADGKALGLKPAFSIIDSDDAYAILQDALATTDKKLIRYAQTRISLWKNAMLDPDAAAAAAANESEHSIARAYRSYLVTLRAYQAVDFDDLILLPVQLFQIEPQALQRWREKIRYLLVDEYQDTNACQYELVKLLVQPRCAFTVVGDDDQSIYGWRGATLANLQRLSTDFADLKTIKLEQNYRSSRHILDAANQLIAHNPKLHDKRLWSDHGPGDPVTIIACDDDEQEAESVMMRLQAHKFDSRSRFGDYAILYRGNHQARVFEQALRKERIPYVLSGGQSFFDRAEIKDLLSYLRLIVNDDDDPAFIRAATTPKRGIGVATLQVLGHYAGQRHLSMFAALFESGLETKLAARQLAPLREFGEFINRIAHRASREPATQVLNDLLAAIDYHAHLSASFDDKAASARWQNVCDFTDWLKRRAEQDDTQLAGHAAEQGAAKATGQGAAKAAGHGAAKAAGQGAVIAAASTGRGMSFLELAQQISLLSQLDRGENNDDVVRLSTIHAAKGLEFGHVFIVGCEEGLLPHLGDAPIDDDSEAATDATLLGRIEEERRLMYVALTRAQRSLHLTWCRQRQRARDVLARKPSRFLAEMGLDNQNDKTVRVSREEGSAKLARLRALLTVPMQARNP